MVVVQRQVVETSMTNDFNPGGKEHKTKTSTLIPIGGKLPYYLEIQSGKLIDILLRYFSNHPNLSSNRQQARTKINNWLYYRTRVGFYQELGEHLHLAYAHQKDGAGSQHYWRLFFDQTNRKFIENIVNSTALVVGNKTPTSQQNNTRNYTEGLKEWNGMYFRSESEIALAEELSHCGLTFFANARGLINTQPSAISHQQATGRLEIDFFVFHKGKCISVEVDGNHHRDVGQTVRDYTRDRLLLREQIPTARFTAEECYKQPALVVKEIVALFNYTMILRYFNVGDKVYLLRNPLVHGTIKSMYYKPSDGDDWDNYTEECICLVHWDDYDCETYIWSGSINRLLP